MSKRKVSSTEGMEVEPKRQSARLSAKPAPAKVETKPIKAAGKAKSSDKKVQTNGKKGAKEKQAEVANQETKDLPAEKGETKNEESPASDEAGENEAKFDYSTYRVLVVPISLLGQSRGIFFQIFYKYKFFK